MLTAQSLPSPYLRLGQDYNDPHARHRGERFYRMHKDGLAAKGEKLLRDGGTHPSAATASYYYGEIFQSNKICLQERGECASRQRLGSKRLMQDKAHDEPHYGEPCHVARQELGGRVSLLIRPSPGCDPRRHEGERRKR